MMLRILSLILVLLSSTPLLAQDIDSLKVDKSLFTRVVDFVGSLLEVDTAYIEPLHYNMQTYLTNKYTYEVYRLTDNSGNSIKFVPTPSMKIGPNICYSLLDVGWSLDLLHLSTKNNRTELDLSLLSQPAGLDLFYRKSGDDYMIRDIKIEDVDTKNMENAPFHGLESSVIGLNAYYIFNHRKFSYPAAFSKTNRQKRSCGSPLAGIGITRHTLNIDWQDLDRVANERMGEPILDKMNNGLQFEKVTYTDLSVSGGYAYNWVFAKNMLFASSLSLALSHKRSISESKHMLDDFEEGMNFSDFKFSDLTLDATGRFGIVWTDDHWFAGTNAIMHSYNYSRQNFYTNNIFGSVSIFAGFNFMVKKKYKKNKK